MIKLILSALLLLSVSFSIPAFSETTMKPKEIILASSNVKEKYQAPKEEKKMTPKKKKDSWFAGVLGLIIIIGFIIL